MEREPVYSQRSLGEPITGTVIKVSSIPDSHFKAEALDRKISLGFYREQFATAKTEQMRDACSALYAKYMLKRVAC